jgi:hypothetical protein
VSPSDRVARAAKQIADHIGKIAGQITNVLDTKERAAYAHVPLAMNTSPDAVSELIRRATTRRLEADPADVQLFQTRDLDGMHCRTPRRTIDWRPPPPEPTKHPQASLPRLGRWRSKLVLLSLFAVAGGVAVLLTSSSNFQVATQMMIAPQPQSPPQPVVITPAPVPEPPPKPDLPTISSPPVAVVTDPVLSEPPPVSKVTKVKKRAHVTRHAAKPAAKHARATASTPAAAPARAPTKRVGRTRPTAQANDSENPL